MTVPQHVAIVMDGNRRWAKKQGLKPSLGHKQMVDHGIQELVEGAKELGIKYLTLWAFSTENWKRDPREVKFLMDLFRDMFGNKAEKLHEKGVKIQTIGDLTRFDQDIQDGVANWKEITKDNQAIVVNFALNYGGRDELLRAIEKATNDGKKGKLTEEEFASYLDTAGMPDPELIIRTSGEQRLSGFLLWQSNYAEFYFPDTLMPDFDRKELKKAIQIFSDRKRNFGG